MSRTFRRYDEYLEAQKKIIIGSIFITRYERSRIIGARALQLSFQASPFVEVPPHLTDPIDIAAFELDQKCLPITILRKMPTRYLDSGEVNKKDIEKYEQKIPVSWLVNEKY